MSWTRPLRRWFRRPLRRTVRWAKSLPLRLLSLEDRTLPSAADLLSVPLSFEPNRGQTDARVDYLARGSGYTAFLDSTQAVLSLDGGADGRPDDVLRLTLVGANRHAAAAGADLQTSYSNYLRGSDPSGWLTNVPHFGRVQYREVYAGIDVVYYGTGQRQLEYDFVVAPGADPRAIGLSFQGQQGMHLEADGDLVLRLPGGDVVQQAPVIYQEVGGARRAVPGGYALGADGKVGFRVGAYDATRPLVIDPLLTYFTYFGGTGTDVANDVALGPDGDQYVVGRTTSIDLQVPQPPDLLAPFQPAAGGGQDAYVARFFGRQLVYATYLGGAGDDEATDLVVMADGSAVVAGSTESDNFPTADAAQGQLQGESDGFLARISGLGTRLIYSTYLGGEEDDSINGVALDADGNAYVTGGTSDAGGFLVVDTPQPYHLDHTFSGVLTEGVEENGTVAVTFTAGRLTGFQFATDIVKPDGTVVTVRARDDELDIEPNEELAFEIVGEETFAAGSTVGYRVVGAVDSSRDVSLTIEFEVFMDGGTSSDPTDDFRAEGTRDGATFRPAEGHEAFITRFSPDGEVTYSTLLGGDNTDEGRAIAVSPHGIVWFAGITASVDNPNTERTEGPPITVDAIQDEPGGGFDVYVAALDFTALEEQIDGSGVLYASYIGGEEADIVEDLAIDAEGNVYFAGWTESPDFPVIRAAQGSFGGDRDGFLTALAADASSYLYSTFLGGREADEARGVAVDHRGDVAVVGFTESEDIRGTPANEGMPLVASARTDLGEFDAHDAFVTRVDIQGGLISSILLGGLASEFANGVALDDRGIAYVVGFSGSNGLGTDFAFQEHRNEGLDGFLAFVRDTIVVNMTTDEGDANTGDGVADIDPDAPGRQVTLRAAIEQANANDGPFPNEIIQFFIPGFDDPNPDDFNPAPTPTIRLTAALPAIERDFLQITGFTQTSGVVRIDGSGAGGDGLTINGGFNDVEGLILSGFSGHGLVFDDGAESNRVGDVTIENSGGHGVRFADGFSNAVVAALIRNSGLDGVAFEGAAYSNTVEDSAILNSFASGVSIQGSFYNQVRDSLIDGNREHGVVIEGVSGFSNTLSNNTIGRSMAEAGQGGNHHLGILIRDGAAFNFVAFNHVSANPDGGIRIADADSNTLFTNEVFDNGGPGIHVQGAGAYGNTITGNFVGLVKGTTVVPGNAGAGVFLDNAPNNTIGELVAVQHFDADGLDDDGIDDDGFDDETFEFIGEGQPDKDLLDDDQVDDDFIHDITQEPLALFNPSNHISGNTGPGILISGAGASGNQLLGNLVGLRFTEGFGTGSFATSPLPNGTAGVLIDNAPGNALDTNVVSGNAGPGILIRGIGAEDTDVERTLVGTDLTGEAARPNQGAGVHIIDAPWGYIGGAGGVPFNRVIEYNVFSGNAGDGVRVEGPNARWTVIENNAIGVGYRGETAVPNTGHGVHILGGARRNSVGGPAPEQANQISFNVGDGVAVVGAASLRNSILSNFIFANGGLGIDLADDGPTANDADDSDVGPNLLQNIPRLLTACPETGIQGFFRGLPNATYRIDGFSNPSADPKVAPVEGEEFVNFIEATTDATGFGWFIIPIAAAATNATATLTDALGNTSEFSLTPSIPVNVLGDLPDADANDGVLDVDLATPGFQITLRAAIDFANLGPCPDLIVFEVPGLGLGEPVVSPESALPAVIHPLTIDATTQPDFGYATIDGGGGDFHGLEATNTTLVLRQLEVMNFGLDGIRATGAGGTLRLEGIAAFDNGGAGVRSEGTVIVVGGGVFTGNGLNGAPDGGGIRLVGDTGTLAHVAPADGQALALTELDISDNLGWGIFAEGDVTLGLPTEGGTGTPSITTIRNNSRGGILSHEGKIRATNVQVLANGGAGLIAEGRVDLIGTLPDSPVQISHNQGPGIYSFEEVKVKVDGGARPEIHNNLGDGVEVAGPFTVVGTIDIRDNGGWGVRAKGHVIINEVFNNVPGVSTIQNNGMKAEIVDHDFDIEVTEEPVFVRRAADPERPRGGILSTDEGVNGTGLQVLGNGAAGILAEKSVLLASGVTTHLRINDNEGPGIYSNGNVEIQAPFGLPPEIVNNLGDGVAVFGAGEDDASGSFRVIGNVIHITDNGGWGVRARSNVLINEVSFSRAKPVLIQRNGLKAEVVDHEFDALVEEDAQFFRRAVPANRPRGGVLSYERGVNGTGWQVVGNGGPGVLAEGLIRLASSPDAHLMVNDNAGPGLYSATGGVEIVVADRDGPEIRNNRGDGIAAFGAGDEQGGGVSVTGQVFITGNAGWGIQSDLGVIINQPGLSNGEPSVIEDNGDGPAVLELIPGTVTEGLVDPDPELQLVVPPAATLRGGILVFKTGFGVTGTGLQVLSNAGPGIFADSDINLESGGDAQSRIVGNTAAGLISENGGVFSQTTFEVRDNGAEGIVTGGAIASPMGGVEGLSVWVQGGATITGNASWGIRADQGVRIGRTLGGVSLSEPTDISGNGAGSEAFFANPLSDLPTFVHVTDDRVRGGGIRSENGEVAVSAATLADNLLDEVSAPTKIDLFDVDLNGADPGTVVVRGEGLDPEFPALPIGLPERGHLIVERVPHPSAGDAPAEFTFPFGFLVLTLPQTAAADVTLTLPQAPPGTTYLLHGPTPDNPVAAWYDFAFNAATGTGAQLNGNVLTLHLADGERGDAALALDNEIRATGGVAVSRVPQVAAGPDAAIDERTRFTRVGSFTDSDSTSFTATVDYGDGTGEQPLALAANRTFTLSHVYTFDGQFTVTVRVTDDSGFTGVDTLDVTVRDVGPNDRDLDGVLDAVEDAAPNGGDGNADGIRDRFQAGVASLPNAADGRYVTLIAPAGTSLRDVTASLAPGGAPSDLAFPVGFLGFTLVGLAPGGAAAVELLLPAGTGVDRFVKFGPTADDPTPHFYDFTDDGATGAEVFPDRVVLHLIDGGRGDADLTADGTITDPGAPAYLTNTPPVVSLGDDLTIAEGSPLGRTGSFTDTNSTTFTAIVDYGDNSGVQPLALNPDRTFLLDHAYADDGVYTVTVRVTDDGDLVGTDTLTVTVENAVPTASIAGAPATSAEGTAIHLTGSATDPGTADTLTFAWSVTKNGAAYASGTGSAFSFTPNDDGEYVVTLTATDDDDGTGTASKTIVVTNVAPTANAGPDQSAVEGDSVTLTGSATDLGAADTHTFAWSVTRNGAPFASGSGATFSFTPDDDGLYVATLTVTDDDGDSHSDSADITVGNADPVAAIAGAPASSPEGAAISPTASASDAGSADTHSFAWSVTKNGVAYASGSGATFSFTPDDDGEYVVTLTATDDDDGVDTDSKTIAVTNVAPTATITGPTAVTAGQSATYTLTASDPSAVDQAAGFTFAIDWDGNGTTDQTVTGPSGTTVAHTFAAAGSFTIRVTATDADNDASAPATLAVTVTAPTGGGPTVELVNGTLTVTGTAGDDTISVRRGSHGTLRVRVNGTDYGPFAAVQRIVVRAGAGHDAVDVADNVSQRAELHGEAGNDSLLGGNGDDHLFGGDGDDLLLAVSGDDCLDGEAGNDVLRGGSGDDVLKGGAGNDELDGNQGDDRLDGGADNDQLDGGNGDDSLEGGEGDDLLDGGNGGDLLSGGAGNDELNGGNGDDVLVGGTGFLDTLVGGQGDDLLGDADGVAAAHGGAGDDTLALAFAAGWNRGGLRQLLGGITGGTGSDRITVGVFNGMTDLDLYGDEPGNGSGGDDVITMHGAWVRARVVGGRGRDTFRNRGVGIVVLDGIEVVEP